jgi:hypothetical protein
MSRTKETLRKIKREPLSVCQMEQPLSTQLKLWKHLENCSFPPIKKYLVFIFYLSNLIIFSFIDILYRCMMVSRIIKIKNDDFLK